MADPQEEMLKKAVEKVMDKVNTAIMERTKIGTRLEKYYPRGTLMRWSNAGAKWHIMPATRVLSRPFIMDGYKVVNLDANEVIVDAPCSTVAVLARMFELPPLPLYGSSAESWSKGN